MSAWALVDFAARVFSEDYDRNVKQFSRDLDSALQSAVFAAAKIGAQQAKINAAPARTGRLINSITARMGNKGPHTFSAYYGPLRVPYARFVEYDTKPHDIVAHGSGMLVFWIKGRKFVIKRVLHPGTTGRHFLGKTIPEVRARAEKAITVSIAGISSRVFGG